MRHPMPRGRLRTILIAASLIGDALLFFGKQLFSKNYSFPWDFRDVQLPLISFLADQLSKKELPLWDPYTYCGNPIYANIQASFFHPLVFLAAAISNLIGLDNLGLLLEWIVVLQVCIGGFATYSLARELGAGRAGAWVSGVIFQTGPYFASRTEQIGAVMAVAWMPVASLAVVRMRKGHVLRNTVIAGVALGMAVLGGFPAATVAVFGFTLLLAIVIAVVRLSPPRTVLLTGAACLLGIGLAGVQFIPTFELTRNSVAKYRLDWLGTGGGLKWQSLVSLVAPNYYHIFDLPNFKGPWDPSFLYLYCSLPGLALAIAAVAFKKNRWTQVFAILCAIGFFWMLGDSTSVWRWLYPMVPTSIRIGIHPEYTYCIFAFCIAILAGLGLTRLLRHYPRAQWAVALWIAADLYLVGSGRPMNRASVKEEPALTRSSFHGSTRLLAEVQRRSEEQFPPARVDTMNTSIDWAQSAPLTHVETGSGCSPFATERIIRLRLGMHPGGRAGWYYPVADPSSRMLDLMSERFLLVGGSANGLEQRIPKLRRVADLPGNTLFENTGALPRAHLVQAITKATFEEAVNLVQHSAIDFATNAVVEGDPKEILSSHQDAEGSVTMTAYSANRMALLTQSPTPAFLVTSEAWYPGWEARIDGKSAAIYPTNVAFRGLFVPAGEHRVEMVFRPRILVWGFATSLMTMALVAALWLAATRSSP